MKWLISWPLAAITCGDSLLAHCTYMHVDVYGLDSHDCARVCAYNIYTCCMVCSCVCIDTYVHIQLTVLCPSPSLPCHRVPPPPVPTALQLDGAHYMLASSLAVFSFAQWKENRVAFLKRLLVTAHARHISPAHITG